MTITQPATQPGTQPGTQRWTVSKSSARGRGGVVASQHHLAAAAGAEILRAGGNAVDAAVATALVVGLVEPWMSGIGGGGVMTLAFPGQAPQVIDFTMISSFGLDPGRFPLAPGEGSGSDMFSWPAVVDGRNVIGYDAIAVPGTLAGFALAIERFGSLPWAEVMAPAVALAKEGLPLDWWTTFRIAVAQRELARFPETATIYLPDGFAPVAGIPGQFRLRLGRLGETFERLAKVGVKDFYEGEIAQRLVEDLQAGGSPISLQDLAAYRPRLGPALEISYRGQSVFTTDGLTAGPMLARCLEGMDQNWRTPSGNEPGGDAYQAYADHLLENFQWRIETQGHAGALFGAAADAREGTTTNLCVVDKDGAMVALTNTLLDTFGSKVVLPQTGVLMNNAIEWFDPRPGGPNSLAAGKRPLTNMCPSVGVKDGKPWFALGACGGRKIMPAVMQLTSFLIDYHAGLEQAFHWPRLHAAEPPVVCDKRLNPAWIQAIREKHSLRVAEDLVFPTEFAVPSGVISLGDGTAEGLAHVMNPSAGAVAA